MVLGKCEMSLSPYQFFYFVNLFQMN